MKRLLAATLGSVLVAGLLVGPTLAAKPLPLNLDSGTIFQQFSVNIAQQNEPVDGGPSIVNPMTNPWCVWSVNDHMDWIAEGSLNPGQTSSRADCKVVDFDPVYTTRQGITAWWSIAPYGFAGVQVFAPVAGLAVSVCYQPQNRCFTPTPVAFEGEWLWQTCIHASYAPDDPALVEIAGSNGGYGVVSTITTTVTNPSNRTVRNIFVRGGISSDHSYPSACGPQQPTLPNSDYPFRWK